MEVVRLLPAASPGEPASGPEVLFLLDAGALRGPGTAAAWGRPWSPPAHHLDTPEQLLACYQLVRQRRPEARVLVFLESGGYGRLCLEWQAGGCRALEPSAAQCVPFGCRAGDFLLEFARRKAADGCDVVVVSNTADIVMECRSAGPRLSHLGFMFVDGEILLPGLLPAQRPADVALAQVPSAARPGEALATPSAAASPERGALHRGPRVQRSISRAGSGLVGQGRRRPLPGGQSPRAMPGGGRARATLGRLPSREVQEEEREETLRDSQLDGAALDDDVADTLVDEADDAYADTVVDLPYRELDLGYEEAFAETLLDYGAIAAADGSQSQPVAALEAAAEPEDVQMTIPLQEEQLAQQPQAPDSAPPEMPLRGLEEVEPEPEHQSQLPEIQSSPELEMEVEDCPASPPRSPAASPQPQPQALGGGAGGSQPLELGGALARQPASGSSQTIDIGAQSASEAAAPPPAAASGEATADAGAGLARQATQVVLPETVAGPASEVSAATGEAAGGGAAAGPDAAPAPAAAGPAAAPPERSAPAAAPATAAAAPTGGAEVAGSVEATAALGSQAATLPARPAEEPRAMPASALVGCWTRDGGREHSVVWAPGPAGSYLEFRPVESNKRALPVVLQGGTWVLNGFYLDSSRSSEGFLHWANPSTGAERSWQRAEASSRGDAGGAAAAVSALAGSFAGEAGR